MKRRNTQLEAVARLLRRQLGDRRLRADDELQLGDEIDDQLAVRAERLVRAVAPVGDARASLWPRSVPDELLEGLRERGIRDVALVLIELARREESARRRRAPGAARGRRRICRCRNSRRPGPAPAAPPATTRSKAASSVVDLGFAAVELLGDHAAGPARRARRARTARSGAAASHSARHRRRSLLGGRRAVW